MYNRISTTYGDVPVVIHRQLDYQAPAFLHIQQEYKAPMLIQF